jgi:lipopolysaccharide/colanic/teichoic acid biosynthesis glycosyltransferase
MMGTRYANGVSKRAVDLVLALGGAILSAPLMVVLAAAILALDGRPVLFRQPRPGRDGRVFTLLKFRTMRVQKLESPQADDARLTSLGTVLRALSLDELPTLLNVIGGDMSLVGPRPLLVEYLSRYTSEQARRHTVRPGITGWAQVNGRNAISWEQKFSLDVWYVDNASLALDLRILLSTVGKVLRREGIGAEGRATMPLFLGSAADKRTDMERT